MPRRLMEHPLTERAIHHFATINPMQQAVAHQTVLAALLHRLQYNLQWLFDVSLTSRISLQAI